MTVAEEAQRYLAVVEFFRVHGCEPSWQPEGEPAHTNPTAKTNDDLLRGSPRGD